MIRKVGANHIINAFKVNASLTSVELSGGWSESSPKIIFIVFKTNYRVELESDIDQDDWDTIKSLCKRNSQLQKSVIQEQIVNIVVAMSSLDLPPYVILEIVDKFDYWSMVNRKFKIDTIIAVNKSCKRIRSSRK